MTTHVIHLTTLSNGQAVFSVGIIFVILTAVGDVVIRPSAACVGLATAGWSRWKVRLSGVSGRTSASDWRVYVIIVMS